MSEPDARQTQADKTERTRVEPGETGERLATKTDLVGVGLTTDMASIMRGTSASDAALA